MTLETRIRSEFKALEAASGSSWPPQGASLLMFLIHCCCYQQLEDVYMDASTSDHQLSFRMAFHDGMPVEKQKWFHANAVGLFPAIHYIRRNKAMDVEEEITTLQGILVKRKLIVHLSDKDHKQKHVTFP